MARQCLECACFSTLLKFFRVFRIFRGYKFFLSFWSLPFLFEISRRTPAFYLSSILHPRLSKMSLRRRHTHTVEVRDVARSRGVRVTGRAGLTGDIALDGRER